MSSPHTNTCAVGILGLQAGEDVKAGTVAGRRCLSAIAPRKINSPPWRIKDLWMPLAVDLPPLSAFDVLRAAVTVSRNEGIRTVAQLRVRLCEMFQGQCASLDVLIDEALMTWASAK